MLADTSTLQDPATEDALGSTPLACEARVDTPPQLSLHAIQLRQLQYTDPLHWLALGWQDFKRCPGIGLFYGSCFVAMGWLLLTVFREATVYTLALSAGFLLIGPFLALGLYYASMRLERGLVPDLGRSLSAWNIRIDSIAIFTLTLLMLEMLWVGTSMVIFALFLEGLPELNGDLMALFSVQHLGFICAYLAVGSAFALLIFSISVISVPLLLEQQVDAIAAMAVSLRLIRTQPGVMLLWGLMLALLMIVAMLPGFAGLLIAGPVIGHASWHAYRSAVHDMSLLVLIDAQEDEDSSANADASTDFQTSISDSSSADADTSSHLIQIDTHQSHTSPRTLVQALVDTPANAH